ncbi:hypothetical protein Tcan_09044 [Toxocara canis]|uniref:Uncharacterized protein n=1 Tax=Toxocara canis TaxID=6265 RepID=A0A0B2V6B3_TOXCA|nr:hypothetical protein Tcan_09044 [Toxocara canis]
MNVIRCCSLLIISATVVMARTVAFQGDKNETRAAGLKCLLARVMGILTVEEAQSKADL